MSRELATLSLDYDTVKCSIPGVLVSYKVFKYCYNFMLGQIEYDILEPYRSEVIKLNNDTITAPVEFITTIVEKESTISEIINLMTKKTGKKPFTKDGVKTIKITTKKPATTKRKTRLARL